ncbi:MAG: hypothetical protein IPN81_11485 [Nitrosomonadales bacterium]|nr:hypothetical protein [Nitrosomonadales bacterium]
MGKQNDHYYALFHGTGHDLGGNPYHDEALDELEGQQIRCTGELDNNEIFMEQWKIET